MLTVKVKLKTYKSYVLNIFQYLMVCVIFFIIVVCRYKYVENHWFKTQVRSYF